MFSPRSPLRAALALTLILVVTGVAVGVPLLDLGRSPGRLGVDDGSVPYGAVAHDHALCVLHGNAHGSPVPLVETTGIERLVEDIPPLEQARALARARLTLHHPRAPPSV